MSHYTVAVFTKKGKSVEDLLAPYDENIEVAPYVSETKEEIIAEAKERKERVLKRMEEDPDFEVDDYARKYLNCKTDEDFYKACTYDDEEYDVNGGRLSTYNPNSKWDWYSIGGRWDGLLKTKDGHKVNECLVKDLDLTPDKKEYDEAIRFWELVVEEQPLRDGEEKPFNWYKKEYYIERYGTKENYAKLKCQIYTYAVLMPNGIWYEPGQMGWFGISGATIDQEKEWDENYHKFLEEAEDDWTITIVDCHI